MSSEGEARADHHRSKSNVSLELKYGPGVSWLPKTPSLSLPDNTTLGTRSFPDQDVASGGGGVTAVGGSFDSTMVFDDRWEVPLLGMGFYGAVGDYDRVRTSADGSIATLRPWTTFMFDLLLPGFGYRVKERRWMFAALARFGASVIVQQGSAAEGTNEQSFMLGKGTMALFGELEACRRLDPLERICLVAQPRILGFGFMNGGTLGLRMEIGR